MESDHIKCPQCGTEIEVGEVLAAQVTVAVETRVRDEAEAKLKQAVAAAQSKERDATRLQMKDMELQLSEKDKAVKAAEAKELALLVSTKLPEATKPTDTVADSVCGTGGFLLAA